MDSSRSGSRQNENEESSTKEVTVVIKSDIAKNYTSILKEKAEEFNISFSRIRLKDNAKGFVFLRIKLLGEDYSIDRILKIGQFLESSKYEAASKNFTDKKENLSKEKNLLEIGFPKVFHKKFKQKYSEELKLDKVQGTSGGGMNYFFDVSDCLNRRQLVRRVMEIHDAFTFIKYNSFYDHEQDELNMIIDSLEGVAFKKVSKRFESMSGKDLIEKGYATLWDENWFFLKPLQRLLNPFFRKYKYYYLGKEVDPSETYIYEHKKPIEIEPEDIDFRKEVMEYYLFGEQMFPGAGMNYVKKFEKSIKDKHNHMIKQIRKLNEQD